MTAGSKHAEEMARLCMEMSGRDEAVTVDALVRNSVELVPGTDYASLTVTQRTRPRTLAATSETAERCDALQYHLDEGPCVEALGEDEWYRSGDLAHDHRWPHWGPRAADEGPRSLLSVRLVNGDHPIGALNLYSERVGAFGDPDTIDLAYIYGLHAAVALSTSREITGLREAMINRHTIGVAQGIVMQRYGLSLERSFEVLRRYSSLSNTKLREVAADVVAQGDLPTLAERPAEVPVPSPTEAPQAH